ncbi:MAG: HAD-IA family hydrolase [Gammaproteobacteria bacterium]|nr:HAD-IA family hydrolase [Gammaproteobacteria bacterium]
MGLDLTHCIELIENEYKTVLPATLLSNYWTRSFAAFETELICVPDDDSIIASLDCPIAVASCSGHKELRFTLGLVDLYQRFNGHIYSVEDVERGKSHPDVYLHAAEQLDVRPERCAVIEDSVNGAKAGVAAGMTVFGYAGLTDAESLSQTGARVFEQMNELYLLLESTFS